jgi:hypothetical protein
VLLQNRGVIMILNLLIIQPGKDVFDSYKYYGHYMINSIFSEVANPPKLDDKVIPNIEFKMRQNGYVGWSFMLFT